MTEQPWTPWWETRRGNEPTNDYLSRVLDELGAPEIAANALAYHYDDFFCPDEIDDGANIHRLVRDVDNWSRRATQNQRDQALQLIEAAKNGEFDGTREEAAAWGRSADGQATYRDLLGGR